MANVTTIRLDPALKKAVDRRAKSIGMDFSEVARVLFTSFSVGEISIGATQYPPKYAAMLQRELREMRERRKKGKAKLYDSVDDMFADIFKS